MPIVSINVNSPGQSGVKPAFIYIDTTDSADDVVVAGYLNDLFAQGIPLSNSDMAVVTTRPSPSSHDITANLYNVTFSSGDWSLVATGGGGGGGVILPTTVNHIAVYADTDGLLYQDAATIYNDGNITAFGNLSAGNVDGGQSGEVHVYPNTVSSGSVVIQAVDVSGGDYSSTIKNSTSISQNTTYTLPKSFGSSVSVAGVEGSPSPGNIVTFGSFNGLLSDSGIPLSSPVINQTSTISVTSAQIKDIVANPVLLLTNPNPFALCILPLSVVVRFIWGTMAYTGDTGNFYISYGSAGAASSVTALPQSSLTVTQNTMFFLYPDTTFTNSVPGNVNGQDLYLFSANNLATGDSDITIQITYQVVLSFF